MCVAIPARVVSIDGNSAIVDVSGNRMNVNIELVSPKIGDYVLLHAGYAVSIVSMEEGQELERLFKELEDCLDENN
jgi:hydrogenase expression/formation protein HypC